MDKWIKHLVTIPPPNPNESFFSRAKTLGKNNKLLVGAYMTTMGVGMAASALNAEPRPDSANEGRREMEASLEQAPLQTSNFEHTGPRGPTNEEVATFQRHFFPNPQQTSLRVTRYLDGQIPMPGVYGIAGYASGAFNAGAHEIVIPRQYVMTTEGQVSHNFYYRIIAHEDAHSISWENAPRLTQEQRDQYRALFIARIRSGVPRIGSAYIDAINNVDQEVEIATKALEYQPEMTRVILSAPFPDTRTQTWAEGMARWIHRSEHIPLENARDEIALFSQMVDIVFPGRTAEAFHRDVSLGFREADQLHQHRLRVNLLCEAFPTDMQTALQQGFTLPTGTSSLNHFVPLEDRRHSQLSRIRHALERRQENLLSQRNHTIKHQAEHRHDVSRFLEALEEWVQSATIDESALPGLSASYHLLSAHDQALIRTQVAGVMQILAFYPSFFPVTPQEQQLIQGRLNQI